MKETMKGIVRSLEANCYFYYNNWPATWKFFYQPYLHDMNFSINYICI